MAERKRWRQVEYDGRKNERVVENEREGKARMGGIEDEEEHFRGIQDSLVKKKAGRLTL